MTQSGERDGAGKVIIANINPGMVTAAFARSLVAMFAHDAATSRSLVGYLDQQSGPLISTARNLIVEQFLAHESCADWLLTIDSDMEFDCTAVDQLLAAADPETAPIVGGLCFFETSTGFVPSILRTSPAGFATTAVVNYPPNQLVQCAATGTAFLLIHRGVLTAMRERNFSTV